mmetsp:Transcript_4041/g.16169  ORF Transcript_4041/g.16169 Transcript_4041/m.16169 type:complete len:372 (-) Transcript_4041:1897-3012(-)
MCWPAPRWDTAPSRGSWARTRRRPARTTTRTMLPRVGTPQTQTAGWPRPMRVPTMTTTKMTTPRVVVGPRQRSDRSWLPRRLARRRPRGTAARLGAASSSSVRQFGDPTMIPRRRHATSSSTRRRRSPPCASRGPTTTTSQTPSTGPTRSSRKTRAISATCSSSRPRRAGGTTPTEHDATEEARSTSRGPKARKGPGARLLLLRRGRPRLRRTGARRSRPPRTSSCSRSSSRSRSPCRAIRATDRGRRASRVWCGWSLCRTRWSACSSAARSSWACSRASSASRSARSGRRFRTSSPRRGRRTGAWRTWRCPRRSGRTCSTSALGWGCRGSCIPSSSTRVPPRTRASTTPTSPSSPSCSSPSRSATPRSWS